MDDTADTAWKHSFNHPLLSYAEERDLFSRLQSATGDERQRIIDKIVTHNQRLVFEIAGRYKAHSMPLPDLIQEGNLGLLRAIEKFDYTLGNKFSTYATYWIRQCCQRSLHEQRGGTLRVPAHIGEAMAQVRRVESMLANGSEPVPAEVISEKTGIPASKVRQVRAAYETRVIASTNLPVQNDSDAEFGDFLASDTDVETDAESSVLSRLIDEALGELLTPRERRVVRHAFGIGLKQADNETVGRQLGISRERVRQIINEALDKLTASEELAAWIGAEANKQVDRRTCKERRPYLNARRRSVSRIREIAELYNQGEHFTDIAARLGVAANTVRGYMPLRFVPQAALDDYAKGLLDIRDLHRIATKEREREERAA